MIKVYAHENIERSIIFSLEQKGFDITSVNRENMRGLSDKDQFDFAVKNERVVLTRDSDFLKICEGREHPGVLYIPKRRKRKEIVKRVVRILELLDSDDLEDQILFV